MGSGTCDSIAPRLCLGPQTYTGGMTEASAPRVGIISYCDRLRTNAHVNHEVYARVHGYTYIFDIAPVSEPPQHKKFFLKIEKIRKFLPLFDWVFWIDDDAFFMGRKTKLTSFIERFPDSTLIFCASPRVSDNWTWMSSGSMFIKNSPLGRQLIDAVMETDLQEVKSWWDADRFGMWTGGDQDAIVYQLMTNPLFQQEGFYARLEPREFNSRPWHFVNGAFENFLLHFTGNDKGRQALEFARKWDLSDALTYHKEVKRLRGLFPAPEPESTESTDASARPAVP